MRRCSLLLLKPEIVAHPSLLKESLAIILAAGITVTGARRTHLTREIAEQLYEQHKKKFFYNRLIRHICSGPVVAFRVSGDVRSIIGSSKLWPLREDQTMRQRLSLSDARNVAHNSDPEAADKELQLLEPFNEPQQILDNILHG